MVCLNPEAADHKDCKEGQDRALCFSWVIYLFMEALHSHFQVRRHHYRSTMGPSCSLQDSRLSLLWCRWEADQLGDDYKAGEVSRGPADHVAGRRVLSLVSACQREDLIPKTVHFLRWFSLSSRTKTERQPREDANSATGDQSPWRHLQNLPPKNTILHITMWHLGTVSLRSSQVNIEKKDLILTGFRSDFNHIYPGGETIDSLGSSGQAIQTKITRMSHFLLKKCLFFCVNSVISHESAMICLFYIFLLLKIVFFIALCCNISLIILTTICNGWNFPALRA